MNETMAEVLQKVVALEIHMEHLRYHQKEMKISTASSLAEIKAELRDLQSWKSKTVNYAAGIGAAAFVGLRVFELLVG